MNRVIRSLPSVLGVGLTWATLWGVFWAIVVVIIGIVDPNSIDPREGPMVVAILGSMGLLSGVVFGILLPIRGHNGSSVDLPPSRVAGWGVLASAIVQLAYLGHGDLGLAANLKMALLFSALGGVVTLVWLVMARRWSHWRSSLSAPEGPPAI